MPRQRISYIRKTYVFPANFHERLKWLKEESDLPWAELTRRIGVYPQTMQRWKQGQSRPSARHMLALLDLAESLGLRHLLTGPRQP